MNDCESCIHKKVCDLWHEQERQDAGCFFLDDCELFESVRYTRLRELAEADKDRRLVVLPVRPVLTQSCASMLYIVDDDEIYEDSLYEAVVGMSSSGRTNVIYTTLSDQMIFGQEAIGKTVFLSREEAEKALQEME